MSRNPPEYSLGEIIPVEDIPKDTLAARASEQDFFDRGDRFNRDEQERRDASVEEVPHLTPQESQDIDRFFDELEHGDPTERWMEEGERLSQRFEEIANRTIEQFERHVDDHHALMKDLVEKREARQAQEAVETYKREMRDALQNLGASRDSALALLAEIHLKQVTADTIPSHKRTPELSTPTPQRETFHVSEEDNLKSTLEARIDHLEKEAEKYQPFSPEREEVAQELKKVSRDLRLLERELAGTTESEAYKKLAKEETEAERKISAFEKIAKELEEETKPAKQELERLRKGLTHAKGKDRTYFRDEIEAMQKKMAPIMQEVREAKVKLQAAKTLQEEKQAARKAIEATEAVTLKSDAVKAIRRRELVRQEMDQLAAEEKSVEDTSAEPEEASPQDTPQETPPSPKHKPPKRASFATSVGEEARTDKHLKREQDRRAREINETKRAYRAWMGQDKAAKELLASSDEQERIMGHQVIIDLEKKRETLSRRLRELGGGFSPEEMRNLKPLPLSAAERKRWEKAYFPEPPVVEGAPTPEEARELKKAEAEAARAERLREEDRQRRFETLKKNIKKTSTPRLRKKLVTLNAKLAEALVPSEEDLRLAEFIEATIKRRDQKRAARPEPAPAEPPALDEAAAEAKLAAELEAHLKTKSDASSPEEPAAPEEDPASKPKDLAAAEALFAKKEEPLRWETLDTEKKAQEAYIGDLFKALHELSGLEREQTPAETAREALLLNVFKERTASEEHLEAELATAQAMGDKETVEWIEDYMVRSGYADLKLIDEDAAA